MLECAVLCCTGYGSYISILFNHYRMRFPGTSLTRRVGFFGNEFRFSVMVTGSSLVLLLLLPRGDGSRLLPGGMLVASILLLLEDIDDGEESASFRGADCGCTDSYLPLW